MKYITKIALALTILFTVVSCKNGIEKTNEKLETNMEKPINLVGKKLEYNYGDYIYHLDFKTDTTLYWKCVEGDEKGKEADETYKTQRLNNHTLFVSWVEADGLGVSQVINLKDYKINCYLKIDKEIIPLNGTIKEL